MNRRKSLKALMLGSAGAATPFISWENVPYPQTTTGEKKKEVIGNNIIDEFVPGDPQIIHLVADNVFINAFGNDVPEGIKFIDKTKLNNESLVKNLAAGEGMIWIGNPDGIPKELSVGAFSISGNTVKVNIRDASPILPGIQAFNNSVVHSAFIKPPKEMPNHNVDEEVRADFLPILDAYDRFGNLVGYPGVLMSYYAQSLAGKRFMGSECFFFLFDEPLKALDNNNWKKIINAISLRRESGLIVTAFDTNFSSYKDGERIQVRTRLYNRRSAAVASVIKYSVKAPGAKFFAPVIEVRRVPESRSETEAIFNFKPEYISGLWTLRMQVLQDVEHAEYPAYDGKPSVVDQRDIGFMMLPEQIKTPAILNFKGPSIEIDNKEGFWAGTHYYPSTSWWEWVWRDFRPLKAAEDFAAIRCSGYRIARIWIDPVIDETVLRAMDATIQLASENGIILDICCFTQWTREMGFERATGEHIVFDFRGKRDFNIVSFSLRNLDLQREFLHIIASRWKNAGNIMYNLANETYVKDPDHTQMDKEAVEWRDIPSANSVLRDSLLFRRWGNEMKAAIRKAGGDQPVFPGYMFSLNGGGDVYAGNTDAPMVSWHSYAPTEQTGLTLSYFDPISSERPILLEELGVLGWNNEANYDGTAHYALGAGAAGAMSYEWGVSWLSREACYWPLPLRDTIVDDPDPRWFPAYVDLFKSWPEKGVGLCPTPSGTGYGSIYHGTPFPAAAAVALGRMGLIGEGLQRVIKGETVYVIVPATNLDAIKPFNEIVKRLWSMKALFGIWQEADINKLPSTAKRVICPIEISASSINKLNSKGVKFFNASDDWQSSAFIEKVSITPAEKIDMMMRRTENGRLFTLVSKEYKGAVELKYNNYTVSLGISDFGLAHVTDKGVTLLEGEKTLSDNKSKVCSINDGRVVIKSQNGPLASSKKLKLMVTRPTKVSFAKRIVSVSISDGFNNVPVKAGNYSGSELTVDDQLARYVIHVTLA